MSQALPKTLKLGLGNFGGYPHLFTSNVCRGGDWATVAHTVGDCRKVNEIMLSAIDEFKKPAYITQMKAYLLSINPDLKFADDQPNGSFISMEDVINKCTSNRKMMDFEVDMIRKNPEKLHAIYLHAKPAKLGRFPREYEYEFYNHLYPIMDVHQAITSMIHGN